LSSCSPLWKDEQGLQNAAALETELNDTGSASAYFASCDDYEHGWRECLWAESLYSQYPQVKERRNSWHEADERFNFPTSVCSGRAESYMAELKAIITVLLTLTMTMTMTMTVTVLKSPQTFHSHP
jgi:hypothetical protein